MSVVRVFTSTTSAIVHHVHYCPLYFFRLLTDELATNQYFDQTYGSSGSRGGKIQGLAGLLPVIFF